MNNVAPFTQRGKTFYGPTATIPSSSNYGTDSISLEGTVVDFDDFAVSTSYGARTRQSNRRTRCVIVRNSSGGTLAAGDVVKWKSAYYGRRVDVKTDSANMEIAGVVDDKLGSGGVRDGDLFLLIIKGRCTAAKATGTSHSVGDDLACNNAGKLTAIGTPGSNTAAMQYAINAAGKCFTAAASGDTTVDAYIDVSRWIC